MQESNIIIYNTEDGKANVVLYAKDGNIWMNQNQLAELFDTSKQNIGQHIDNILSEKELDKNSVVKNYFTTASDGKNYNVTFYSLDMILAIGFRVRSKRGTQFRIWANRNLREFMVKGFLIDDERLKNPDGRPDYFDELLERIRDIRASEKRFYQKVRDLLSLSSDYDKTDKSTQMFFAETQNKLLYAVTHQTTVLFLDSAELRVKERKDLTLNYWRNNVDLLLNFQNKDVLKDAGSISNVQMEQIVDAVYEEFNNRRKLYAIEQANKEEKEDLFAVEKLLKQRKTKNYQ